MKTLLQSKTRQWILFVGVLLTVAVFVGPSLAQSDVIGTMTVTGGNLSMTAGDDPAFTGVTLDGTDQTPNDTIDIDVKDLTGTGAGWNLQITSTTFNGGSGHTLATTATTITGVSSVCDTGTCTNPTNVIGYALTVPADTAPPLAATFFNAAVTTGMGDFTITPTFELSVPAATYAGTYTSTMTLTLASAP